MAGWDTTGTDTAYTKTGLSLTSGLSYYISIRAIDNAGNESLVVTSDGVTVDTAAPYGTIVYDGAGADINYTGSDNTLSANWPPFTDEISGIANYEYAIGTTIGGTEIIEWESTGTDTIFTKTGLSLSSGLSYYISIRAADNVGNVGAAITSHGVTVDLSLIHI